jgi:hypothetical protein
MLEAYLDESGIHDQAKVCVVAGFYGRQAAWRRFERQWNTGLKNHPELKDGFHAKVFFGRSNGKRVGPYKDWSDEKAQQFLNYLLKCIRDNWIFPIGFGIVVEDFMQLPLKSRQWLTGARFRVGDGEYLSGGCPRKSYYLPFQFCVLGAGQISGAPEHDKIQCFAGLDRTFSGYATELYKFCATDPRIPESLRSRLGGISYPLSKDTPGIQVADLLAYCMYQHSAELVKDGQKPTPELLRKLCKRAKKKQHFTLFNSGAIRELERVAQEQYQRWLGGGEYNSRRSQ